MGVPVRPAPSGDGRDARAPQNSTAHASSRLAVHYHAAGHDRLIVGIGLARTVSDMDIILYARSRGAVILTWNHKHLMLEL